MAPPESFSSLITHKADATMFIDSISRRLDQIIVEAAKSHPENLLMQGMAQDIASSYSGARERPSRRATVESSGKE